MLVYAWHHGAKEMALEILRDPEVHIHYEFGDEKDDSNLHWRAVYYQQPECLQLLLARFPIGGGSEMSLSFNVLMPLLGRSRVELQKK